MHMYSAAIDALPFAEDKKFHKRADVVLDGLRKLRTALGDAASSNRPSPAVIVELSNVRRRYDYLMEHAAAAPGSSLGQQLYVTRVHAKLSAEEVANGAGLPTHLPDELEAGGTPNDRRGRKDPGHDRRARRSARHRTPAAPRARSPRCRGAPRPRRLTRQRSRRTFRRGARRLSRRKILAEKVSGRPAPATPTYKSDPARGRRRRGAHMINTLAYPRLT